MPFGGIAAAIGGAIGVDAATVAAVVSTVGEGALVGGGLGAAEGALTGGNIGQDALKGGIGGALTGGGIGIGGALGGAELGGALGTGFGDVAGGALGGGVGSYATGGKFGTGALEGGLSGGVSGLINANSGAATSPVPGATANISSPATSTGGGTVGGAGTIAGGSAAPPGFGSSPDVTTDPNFNNFLGSNAPGGVSQTGFNSNVLGTPTDAGGAATGTASPFGGAAGPTVANESLGQSTGVNPLTGAGATPAAATPAPNSFVTAVKSLFDGQSGTSGPAFENFLSTNAGAAVPTAVLGADAIMGNKAPKGTNALESEAGQLATQGQNLESYLQSGTLPAGLQGAVQQNLASQQAAIKSRYAAEGASGSSAEQQDLANAAAQSQAQSAQLAEQLLSTGIAETGDASGIYQNLIKDVTSSDQGLSNALATFSQAVAGNGNAGKPGTITINTTPSTTSG